MNRTFLYLSIVFVGICGSFAQNQQEKLKMPGPEVQNLMLGTWSTQVKYEPTSEMPNGGTGAGTEIWRPGPGGLSVIEEYREKNEKGEVEGLGVAWWDAKAQGQRFVWCDNSIPDGCYVSKEVAKWDGGSLAWKEEQENAGKMRMYSEVFRDISPTSFTQVLAEGDSDASLKTSVTIRATKRLPSLTAQTQEADVRELGRLETVWNEAHERGDADALEKLWADDMEVAVPKMPVLAKADALKFARSGHMKFLNYATSDIRVRVYDNAAVVTGRLQRTRSMNGQEISDNWRFTKTYVREAGQWRVVSFHASEAAQP
jgi:ketosteroid isomerase-like protein